MHEASIAQNVIAAVEQRMERGEIPARLRRIFLRVGVLQAVVRDSLEFLFGVLSEGTRLHGVALVVEPVPARGACRVCGQRFDIDGLWFLCPDCGAADVSLVSGNELLIAEVEVADADAKGEVQ